MNELEFKQRTRVESLPTTRTADVIGRQLIRSGTAIGANYRAACRGVSRADMISKMGDVEEEADETLYWMGILAMSVASIRTMRKKIQNPKSKI